MKLFSGREASHFGQYKPKWHINNYLQDMDIFGKEVPGFNIKGMHHLGTAMGGLVTAILLTISLIYAMIKTLHLVNAANPVMSALTIPGYYSSMDRFYLNEAKFRMAFSVEGYLDGENKNDPRYVKWFTRIIARKNGEEYEKLLPHYKCTEKDYQQFYPVAAKNEKALGLIKANEKRGLYCIDWTSDDMFVFGEDYNPDFQRIEFVLVPCNYVHQKWGYTGDKIDKECVQDHKEQLKYLGPLNFLLYFNDEEFDQQKFNDESIMR